MPGQKTEKATPKKRQEQRKEGNVVQSPDIVGALVLLSVFGTMKAFGGQFVNAVANAMHFFLSGIGSMINGGSDMGERYAIVLSISAQVLLPIILVNIIVSIVATFAQTKLLVNPNIVKFKLSKINPINGIKNLFSPKSLVEVLKSIIKTVILCTIIYNEIQANMPKILTIYGKSVSVSVSWTAQFVLEICIKASVAFLIIGVADYFFQWWDYERRIKMSKEEIKEEFKQTEGNPETKGRIKSEQKKMAQRRQMQAVPTADVVIRNPTHYAIALKYDREKAKAPVVVAKGQNNLALKIVEIAQASKVHIIENRPLAQALYKTVEVGDEIPEQFYKAVAEVLAFIYRLKRAGRA